MTGNRLAGKIALITGVGGGVIGCDRDGSAAAATERAVRDAGGDIHVMGGVDLGDAARGGPLGRHVDGGGSVLG